MSLILPCHVNTLHTGSRYAPNNKWRSAQSVWPFMYGYSIYTLCSLISTLFWFYLTLVHIKNIFLKRVTISLNILLRTHYLYIVIMHIDYYSHWFSHSTMYLCNLSWLRLVIQYYLPRKSRYVLEVKVFVLPLAITRDLVHTYKHRLIS